MGASVYTLGTRRPRTDWPGTRQTPGLPDVLVFLKRPGHAGRELLAVECKRPGGRLSPDQAGFRDLCQLAGVLHVVGGLDAVLAVLTDRGYLEQRRKDDGAREAL
jgi:hypothetical protein